ncbi:hypothetical protein R3P38DRAFT_2808725 [Favolaschia claudopus]|uniref:Uncharacterized protein n=1 Tax=Favolaschia claudopus TaxID=2862362 RepID=A0AAV9ZFZ3_9AGAR
MLGVYRASWRSILQQETWAALKDQTWNSNNSSGQLKLQITVVPTCRVSEGNSVVRDTTDCLQTSVIHFDLLASSLVFSQAGFPTRQSSYNLSADAYEYGLFPEYDGGTAQIQEGMSTLVHNMFQILFHLVRFELGVLLPNQIFASPGMFNESILPVSLPPQFNQAYTIPPAFGLHDWELMLNFFNQTDRVPVMEYSRTVPKLKPLGSAITSVFVATFAMLSTIWTIFSIVAGAVARIYDGEYSLPLLTSDWFIGF